MKLYVIIPVYQVCDTLDRCVESVLGQIAEDDRIILVDDGSTDGSSGKCDEWAERNRLVAVIHQENAGLSAARNAGLDYIASLSEEDNAFVTFVDSDDFVADGSYLELRNTLSEQPDIDILEYPVYWHYGAPEAHVMKFGRCSFTDMRSYWLDCQAYIHTFAWNKIYRVSTIGQHRFPVGRIFEDAAFLPVVLQEARVVATTDKGLYYYCANSSGIAANANGQHLKMLLESHLKTMEMWNDDAFYMHVFNIQIDVCRLTGESPILPLRRVNPFVRGISWQQRIKAVLLDVFGFRFFTV